MPTADGRTPALLLGTAAATLAGAVVLAGAAWWRRRRPPLDLADGVDLGRYVGGWYEIMRLPTRYEAGCTDVTATYVMSDDGTLQVINRCRRDGELEEVCGTARVPDPTEPARLKVQFQWPFQGDYCILRVDDRYRWALVGTPDRRQAWILSRQPWLPDNVVNRLLAELEGQGFDSMAMTPTRQRLADARELPRDVATASRDSFPASDPPAWAGGHA